MITLISNHYDLQKLSGVQFHLQELGLFLLENYELDVKEYILHKCIINRFSVTAPKYKTMLPITSIPSNTILTEMNAIYAMIRDHEQHTLLVAKKIFLLASDSMDKMCEMISAMPDGSHILHQILDKSTIITDRNVPHTLQSYSLPEVLVDRGIYASSWKKKEGEENTSRLWFYYKRPDMLGGLERSEFLVPEDMKYTSKRIACPEFIYKGLIYNRYHDYIPRLPFEFWNNNKPVYFTDISDGLYRMLPNIPLTTGSSIVVTPDEFPKWGVEELASCLI